MLLCDSSPNSVDVLSKEGIDLDGNDVILKLLRDHLVVELLVAADLAENAEDLLNVDDLVLAEDVLRMSSHDVDLIKRKSTRS